MSAALAAQRAMLAPVVVLALGCGTDRAPVVTTVARPSPESVRLAAGAAFSCAITDAAEVVCWGDVPAEVVGRDEADRVRAPHRIVGLAEVHELAADDDTLCARTASRHVLCWGSDVRGGVRDRPTELTELRGATSIAVTGARVCAAIDGRMQCVGPNAPRVRDALTEGAWLEAVGGSVCALDGHGPARCADAQASTLWPITGSEGAVSLSLARGVCAVTREGSLRCDDAALTPEEASLREVDGVTDARLVQGSPRVRCVARADRTECEDRASSAGALVLEGAPRALAVSWSEAGWHACTLSTVTTGSGLACGGIDTVGEATGHAPAAVAELAHAEAVRAMLVLPGRLVVVTQTGAVERRRFDRSGVEVTPGAWLDLAKCDADPSGVALCGRTEDGGLAWLEDARAPVPGLEATGAPFAASGRVCAPRGDGVVCVDRDGGRVDVPGLASPSSFEGRLCGVRAGRIVCSEPRRPVLGALAPDPAALAPLDGTPNDVVRIFAGAEQLFAELRGGRWIAVGHNGVGQLGLPPSRPVGRPVASSASAFTAMAFAYHLSCGWNESGPMVCAGLDRGLRPRVLGPPSGLGLDGAPGPEPDRGEGGWTPIPDVHDVRAVDSDGRITCALDVRGEVRCWGGEHGGVGPRAVPATPIALPQVE